MVLLGLGVCACSESDDSNGATTSSGSGTGGSGGSGTTTMCGPNLLTQTNLGLVGSMTALISDGTNLFYSTFPDLSGGGAVDKPSHIVRLPVSGGTPVMLATTTGAGTALSSLAIDDTNVYYYFYDAGLSKVAKTGGTSTMLTDVGLLQLTVNFVVDATSIFFADRGVLSRISKDGGTPTELWKDDNVVITNLVNDTDDLYFVGYPPIDFGSDAGITELSSVYRIAKTGGTPTKIFQVMGDLTLAEDIWLLALDGPNLVYSTSTDPFGDQPVRALYSLAKTGGTPTKLVEGGPAFAAQGGTAYYAESGRLMKVSESGGAPVDLGVPAPGGAAAMAVDATNVYWERYGCIYKAAR